MNDDASPLAGTEIHYLRSEAVADEFKIFVGHCGNTRDEPAAVLYLTDANGQFGTAVDVVRAMQLSAHLPSLLVVGVGYRLGGLGDTIEVRTRDLTPTVDRGFARLFPAQPRMGGAQNLLAFLTTELQPWVASRYTVDADRAAYFGHSFGGLFGLYALLRAPETFRYYGISSPSLWWHREVMFTLEDEYAAEHDDLDAKVFFAIGGDEDHDGRVREAAREPEEAREIARSYPVDMVDLMTRMVERLRNRNYPSLGLGSIVLPDEFHVTVAPVALSRALRYLFDAPV